MQRKGSEGQASHNRPCRKPLRRQHNERSRAGTGLQVALTAMRVLALQVLRLEAPHGRDRAGAPRTN